MFFDVSLALEGWKFDFGRVEEGEIEKLEAKRVGKGRNKCVGLISSTVLEY